MSGMPPPEAPGADHRENSGPPPAPAGASSSPRGASQRPGPGVSPPPATDAGALDGPVAPAGPAPQIADIGRRVNADLVDFLVLALLGATVGFVLQRLGFRDLVTPGVGSEGRSGLGLPAVPATLMTLAIHLGYWTLMEGRGGQSVGKRAFRIRAVRKDVSGLDYSTAFKRHVLFYIPQLFAWVPSLVVLGLAVVAQAALLLAGLITYIVDAPLRQGFHDKFADTIVVNA